MPGLPHFYALRCKGWLPDRGRFGLLSVVMALAMGWLLATSLPAQATAPTTATRVYGQGGSFTSGTPNNGGISANSLNGPIAVATDGSGGVYVADEVNNRVLHYSGSSTTADRVYGQGGSFTSDIENNGGVSATSLDYPHWIAPDGSGGIYVADLFNNRVLHYTGSSTTADRVYGQKGSFTSNTLNNGGISANSLCYPVVVALDGGGGLYIVDIGNNRILHYSGSSTTADRVYGQGGSFTSGTANNGGISANSLSNPAALAIDTKGGVYVADEVNSRVLHYSGSNTTADRVYGQGGSFTSNTPNKGGISAHSLYYPTGVALDGGEGLYVADLFNNRLLHYSGSSMTADRVYGQGGSFTSNTPNKGGVSANSLNGPIAVATDGSGGVYVADDVNNRVLYYAPPPPASVSATAGSGQSTILGAAFATRLVAKVVDSSNSPVSSALVTFTAPLSGAGGTFTGGSAVYTGTTDASGIVTSTTFTANTLAGSYNVTASVSGVITPANFQLTNTTECNPLQVTSTGDDVSCGTLRQAVSYASTSPTKTVTVNLPAGTTITLTSGLTLTSGVSITTTTSCGAGPNNTMLPPVTIQGMGASSGNGLTLSGNNQLYGLWVRGFSKVQVKALVGSSTKMQCVKASRL